MNLLSKIVILVVFVAAAASLFVTATLYFHRQDFHDKWIRETQAHVATLQFKDAEIQHRQNVISQQRAVIDSQAVQVATLSTSLGQTIGEVEQRNQQIAELQAQITSLQETIRSFVSQTDAAMQMIDALNQRIQDLETRRQQADARATAAEARATDSSSRVDDLQGQVAQLEARNVELARQVSEMTARLSQVDPAVLDAYILPTPVDTFVRGVDLELGLVVLAAGHETGVREGAEFTIYRDASFVAKVRIDKVERDFSAGRVVQQMTPPRVGDRASNRILRGGAAPAGAGR